MAKVMWFPSRLLRHPTYVKPVFAQAYCPLEVIAESSGEEATKGLIDGSPRIAAIADAVMCLLDDAEGKRALEKALHKIIEERMRCMAVALDDPRQYGFGELNVDPGPHPLDRHCAAALDDAASEDIGARLHRAGWPLKISVAGRLVLRLKVFAASVVVMWRALSALVRRGRKSVKPHQTAALLYNFWGWDQFDALAEAAKATGYDDPDQFTMLIERPGKLPTQGYRFLDPKEFKLPRAEWCKRVLWPTWRLAFSVIGHAGRGDAEVVFTAYEALRIAATSLSVWPMAMNVRCRTYSDVIDYLPESAIKGAIFRKSGAKLVRWPTSQIDTYGCLLSNSAHDHFVSSGNYLSHTFSRNWRSPQGARAIGLVQADKRLTRLDRVNVNLRERIERLHEDKKMLAFFGTSPEEGLWPLISSVLYAVIDIVKENPDWFLVVKSKRYTAFMTLVSALPEFADWQADQRIIFVDYKDNAGEICPSNWLADRMDLGTGDAGSILGECVARARPYCTHYPVVYNTPFKKILTENDILVTDMAYFKTRIAEAMRGNIPSVATDWARWAFDPYQDDRALERLCAILVDDGPLETAFLE